MHYGLRKYNYTYDNLNRLLEANYLKPQSSSLFDSYLEKISYDKNGNILSLLRNGDQDTDGYSFIYNIDDLEYFYDTNVSGNKLLKVMDKTGNTSGFDEGKDYESGDCDGIVDNTNDYSYDDFGNLVSDENKGIEKIFYNHLNLPVLITFFNSNNKISYIYNATGVKLGKILEEELESPPGDGEGVELRTNETNAITNVMTETDYLSGFQYKNQKLKFFPHAEGYVNATEIQMLSGDTGYGFNYVFNYTDHLGNVRLSFGEDPTTNSVKIIEENHYYPFGLKHSNYNSDYLMYSRFNSQNIVLGRPPAGGPPTIVEQQYKYKYNGKEWQDELGLNAYDLGARLYDPALARFMVQDPMADFINYQSPYVVSDNNPVLYVDEYGLGIFRAIGNLFSRGAFAVKKLFSGKNCNCSQFQGESLADAWNQPDFPALSNLFSGNGRRNKGNNSNSTAIEKPFKGDMVTAIDIQPIENATPNFTLPEISMPVYVDNKPEVKKPRVPVFSGNKIPSGTSVNLNITFQRSRYLVEPTDSNLKIINDLVKTLKEYPEIKIVISGNMLSSDPNNAKINTLEGETSVVNFKSERAKAILKILQGKGIPASRIQTKPGNSKSMSIDVQFKY